MRYFLLALAAIVFSLLGGEAFAQSNQPPIGWTQLSVPISVSATTVQLVPAATGKWIYVSSWDATANGTGTFQLEYGTGTNCGTGTTALTGVYNWIAQAGIAKGDGAGVVLVIPSGNALCAVSTTTVGGSLSYSQF